MTIHNLEENNSILNRFISEIRDVDIQKDSLRFRRNIERIGEILCYEMSKSLDFNTVNIETPLGVKKTELNEENLVLCSVLRAGLTLHQGVLNYFDHIENAFISAFRNHHTDEDFEIIVEYLASPSLEDKILILVDPMLATGKSLVEVLLALEKVGKPKQIHILSVISSREGIDYVDKNFPKNTHLWVASIDPKLNHKGYIIPGLGDAGDLAYGIKL